LPLKMPNKHPRRRYVLSVVNVRIAEHANMSALNVASLIFLSYRCNIVQEVALTSTCIRVKILSSWFFEMLRNSDWYQVTDVSVYLIAQFLRVKKFLRCLTLGF